MSAEALIFFDPDLAAATLYRRKRAGHLLSKGRSLAAQILAMLEDGVWMQNARAANDAAARLAAAAGGRLVFPVEANEVFLNASPPRSDEHTSELQSLMRISYAVFCLQHNIL